MENKVGATQGHKGASEPAPELDLLESESESVSPGVLRGQQNLHLALYIVESTAMNLSQSLRSEAAQKHPCTALCNRANFLFFEYEIKNEASGTFPPRTSPTSSGTSGASRSAMGSSAFKGASARAKAN